MKFVKSNYRATLKNEHLGELICIALTTYCADFRGLEHQKKLNTDNYCTSINVKLTFFTMGCRLRPETISPLFADFSSTTHVYRLYRDSSLYPK